MGQECLIDTNVLIDAQMGRLTGRGLDYLANVINRNFTISFITLIEYLGYKEITKSSEEFISFAKVIEIDKLIMSAQVMLLRFISLNEVVVNCSILLLIE